jgi:hypothetical protein
MALNLCESNLPSEDISVLLGFGREKTSCGQSEDFAST